ncbi:P-loop containing nucleoside triphosphate hydrolase protein [Wilcoxina mikolae CBS 423.85]|nr:P-loop containing nucleoside triphosphate hydrolase protein [Wilcoxina mikolae CBS 423.85]
MAFNTEDLDLSKTALQELDIIYVLGGPGVGKGTQCTKLSRDFGFAHISVGDLLREEMKDPSSPHRELIEQRMKEGGLVPPYLSNGVLLREIEKYTVDGQKKFLVDGFPRSMDQVVEFENICKSRFTLFFYAPKDVMQQRVLGRFGTEGRFDDDRAIFNLRVDGFLRDTMPVIEYLRQESEVFTIDCEGPLQDAYIVIKDLITEKYLGGKAGTEIEST